MLTGSGLAEREIDAFEGALKEGEDWIIQRVIDYATELGYSKYASPVREAWRVAIRGLIASLVDAVRAAGGNLDIPADEPVETDHALAFGIREAGLHRSRGADFAMFLGLMKYNEQAFVDFVVEMQVEDDLKARLERAVRRFFDRVEIGVATEWSGLSAEQAIAEMQDRNVFMTGEKDLYLRLFEVAETPLLLAPSGRITNINERAADVFGIEGVKGSSYYSKQGVGEFFEPLADDIASFVSGGGAGRLYDREVQTADGPRHYMIRMQRISDVSGECTHVVLMLSDVTDLRHMQLELERQVEERTEALRVTNEDLVEASRAKDNFLAAMSHEFRTPLNSIIGFSKLLGSGMPGTVNEEQSKQLAMITSSGELLLRLVNDLLDLSRIEAGQLDLVLSEFEIAGLCKSLVGMMSPLAEGKGVSLECGGECEEVVVRTDRDKVTQIMLNLVSNAVKFTDEGTVRVFCSCDRASGCVRISVHDTGCGVPESDLMRIFDEFRRSESVLSSAEGTGLGLAIARKLARLLGGEVEVESKVGAGSVFTLVLPLEVNS
ncbi:MAG: hypothetical protein JXA36_00765 [Coriobacteriia bacterium]|nr:hypothetical protein [Coriobacteriia bacterium]